jgi:hypothetical protein
MKRACDFRMPTSMPQVSRLRRVLEEAEARNWVRSWEGRKTGRRGSPFSRYAVGWKVKASRSEVGVGGRAEGSLSGRGGALEVCLPGTGGGWE